MEDDLLPARIACCPCEANLKTSLLGVSGRRKGTVENVFYQELFFPSHTPRQSHGTIEPCFLIWMDLLMRPGN